MIKYLHLFPYYGVSENIEIAKGKYEVALSFRKLKEQRKRSKIWQTIQKK